MDPKFTADQETTSSGVRILLHEDSGCSFPGLWVDFERDGRIDFAALLQPHQAQDLAASLTEWVRRCQTSWEWMEFCARDVAAGRGKMVAEVEAQP